MSGEDIKTKVCSKCGKELPMTDEYFYKNGDRYRSACKECEYKRHKEYCETHKEKQSQYSHYYYARNKNKYRNYYAKRQREFLAKWRKPCQKCGEQRLYLIQFHHIDPTTKEFNIGDGLSHKNAKTCEEEIKKCVCLCSNCHDEFHYFYGKHPKDPVNAIKEYLKE